MNSHTTWTRKLLVRDLESLITEIELFPDDESIWTLMPGIANSAGTLALHLCGNLQHFIGQVLGNSGYVRNRDLEFSQRGLTRGAVVTEIRKTVDVLDAVLSKRPDEKLLEDYPDVLGGLRLPEGLFLQHLATHLAFHLGQVGYHRRMVTGESKSSDAVSVRALS